MGRNIGIYRPFLAVISEHLHLISTHRRTSGFELSFIVRPEEETMMLDSWTWTEIHNLLQGFPYRDITISNGFKPLPHQRSDFREAMIMLYEALSNSLVVESQTPLYRQSSESPSFSAYGIHLAD
jgi:hypothetical protein